MCHTESVTEVIVNLASELKTLSEHLFVAAWQQRQDGLIVLNMDLIYKTIHVVAQNEIQSAHWSHNQVSVQPTVAYYGCTERDCSKVLTEHDIHIRRQST